jgi:hypothetical protein
MIFARDCASNSLRPDVLKIQSKISLITHLHCNRCIAASRVGSVNIRLSIQWIVPTGRTAFSRAIHMEIGRKTSFTRVVMVIGALPSGFRPWAWFASALCEIGDRVRSIPGWPRPSGARPATPAVIAIGPARRFVRSESDATRRTGDAGSGAFR